MSNAHGQAKAAGCLSATRLPNGHTLIAGNSDATEIDQANKRGLGMLQGGPTFSGPDVDRCPPADWCWGWSGQGGR